MKIFFPYSVKKPGSVNLLSVVYLPLSSASAAITGLIEEPGGYRPCVARLTSALPVAGREPWTARLGSKLGQDALTSTRPVRGSIAKTAPALPVAASALIAARCAAGISESCTSSPSTVPPASECSSLSSAPPRSVCAPIR